jgi:hypothetical protein
MRIDHTLAFILSLALAFVLGCPSDDDDDTTATDDDDTTAPDDDDTTATDDDDTTPAEVEGDEAGECDDGVDNDQDGLTDCDDDGCAAATGCEDVDGDGWTVQDGDCDDSDETIHPEAEEGCDGIDTDCDGSLSEEEVDDDGDGFTECDGDCDDSDAELNLDDADGDGVDTCSDDCDDEDETSYPGATEVCDDLDNDCDGTPDNGLAFDTYYPDADSDLHGDVSDAGEYTCAPQLGWVADNTDCDDSDDTVHEGAAELCDAIDNDCDGSPDASEVDGDLDGYMICEGDCDDDDGTVYPGATEDCNGVDDDCDGTVPSDEDDGDADGVRVCGGDCDDADAANFPGNTEVCDGQDNDCDGLATANEVDDDGDGAMVCEGDCDDADPSRHPGATELCEGLDTDCDGVLPVDENDFDGDGWMGCEECDDDDAEMHPDDNDGDGYSPCGGDCDDGEAAAYPGGVEVCDGIDNNCDGSLSATEVDADGDGSMVCEGDCEDGDASVYPGASEVCDGIDNNCNGTIPADEDDADGDGWMVCENDCDDTDTAVHDGAPDVCDAHLDNDCDGHTDPMEADNDGDGATECGGDCDDADVALNVQDVDGDGWTTCDGDCNDGDADMNPGETEVCDDGIDNDCDGGAGACGYYGHYSVLDADAMFIGEETGDYAGYGQIGRGDLDGDGFSDLVMGAYGNDAGGTDAGAAYVFYGPLYGTFDMAAADAKLIGEEDSDFAGMLTIGAGDNDADGNDDVLIGARQDDDGGDNAGAAYLLRGPIHGVRELSTADAKLIGETAGDRAGINGGNAGDVDGDGEDDLIVTADLNDEGGTDAGAAYLFYYSVNGNVDLSGADAKLTGESAEDYAGQAASPAGDVDGDGFADLLVGAIGDDEGGTNAGAIYLVYGPVHGTLGLASAAGAKFVGEEASDQAGYLSRSSGDMDADGFDDIFVGACYNAEGGSRAGANYVIYGPAYGTIDLSAASAKLIGEGANDKLGGPAIGDFDGDGFDDMMTSAPGHYSLVSHDRRAYMVYGPVYGDLDLSLADAEIQGEDSTDRAGGATAVGDVDDDGLIDFTISDYRNDDGGTDAGKVYLFYGHGM